MQDYPKTLEEQPSPEEYAAMLREAGVKKTRAEHKVEYYKKYIAWRKVIAEKYAVTVENKALAELLDNPPSVRFLDAVKHSSITKFKSEYLHLRREAALYEVLAELKDGRVVIVIGGTFIRGKKICSSMEVAKENLGSILKKRGICSVKPDGRQCQFSRRKIAQIFIVCKERNEKEVLEFEHIEHVVSKKRTRKKRTTIPKIASSPKAKTFSYKVSQPRLALAEVGLRIPKGIKPILAHEAKQGRLIYGVYGHRQKGAKRIYWTPAIFDCVTNEVLAQSGAFQSEVEAEDVLFKMKLSKLKVA